MKQTVITPEDDYRKLDEWIRENQIRQLLLVCGRSFDELTDIRTHLNQLISQRLGIVRFSDFSPNPQYDSAEQGVSVYNQNRCNGIMAVGGGSAIDVAKCIKSFSKTNAPLLAMPTTAGSGSEATAFAVVYRDKMKISVEHESCIPAVVLMDPGALKQLPLYQRKTTMMDAFSHAIESFLSVNSTQESRSYSKRAIRQVLSNLDGYLKNLDAGNAGMLSAANMAGKAINQTYTTAGHAMSYGITSMFGVAHGHAAILCNRILFPWTMEHTERCVDKRGKKYLEGIFDEIAESMGCVNAREAAEKIDKIFASLELTVPQANDGQIKELVKTVNAQRLKNHPVDLDEALIDALYRRILNGRR